VISALLTDEQNPDEGSSDKRRAAAADDPEPAFRGGVSAPSGATFWDSLDLRRDDSRDANCATLDPWTKHRRPRHVKAEVNSLFPCRSGKRSSISWGCSSHVTSTRCRHAGG
jgi:hypothetical protein